MVPQTNKLPFDQNDYCPQMATFYFLFILVFRLICVGGHVCVCIEIIDFLKNIPMQMKMQGGFY